MKEKTSVLEELQGKENPCICEDCSGDPAPYPDGEGGTYRGYSSAEDSTM